MRFITGLIWFVISLFAYADQPRCVLFYYSPDAVDEDILHAYDWIILSPENRTLDSLKYRFYLKKRARLIAYVSVGERREKKYRALGRNEMWDTYVVDLRDEKYVKDLLGEVERILEKGYDGVFLDTLDSYRAFVPLEGWQEYEKILTGIVRAIKERFPDKLVILNRGFELLESLKGLVDGVVAESLFRGLSREREYVEVGKEEREWLLERLRLVRALGVPVVVVDYLPPENHREALEVLRKIENLGFIPYVGDRHLSLYGYSPCSPLPRKVILLYDSSLEPDPHEADIHLLLQMPLEYLGFVPVLHDVRKQLPEPTLGGGYAGVVSMHIGSPTPALEEWLIRVKRRGIKVLFVEDLPLKSEKALREFGLSLQSTSFLPRPKVLKVAGGSGYEAPYVPKVGSYAVEARGRVLIELFVEGKRHTPLVLTEWGGLALDNSLVNDEGLWIYEPFSFLAEVFGRLPLVPDVTTENGRRILTVHVDGDGFHGRSEVAPGKISAEVIRDEVVRKFPVPHTISVIEAEIAPWGINPEESPRLEEVARSIFRLPNVEPASHSFSHPFTWTPERNDKKLMYGYNLPVAGYKLNFKREILGSVKYINERLLKGTGKRVRVFLWTGYCNPTEEHLRIAYGAGLLNANGGDTTITRTRPFLKFVSPMGINMGELFQVYAPVQNENVYTNEWTNPLWGYIKVIQTFELTERPRRLKPLSIYYHFYSGERFASLNALKKVYEYALSQEVIPLYFSDYIRKVLDFRGLALIKIKGGFLVKGEGKLRTLRIPRKAGYPDLKRSRGVVGYRESGNFLYVHLDGSGTYEIFLSEREPEFRIVSTNGVVREFVKGEGTYELSLSSYADLELEWEGSCRVYLNGKELKERKLRLPGVRDGKVKAVCAD